MKNETARDDRFQDPLENYDPKTYADPLEEAVCEQQSSTIQHEPYTSIPPDMTVAEAVRKLASAHIACLLVEEQGELVGVFTHREVLNKVALEDNVHKLPVREVMTTNPIYVRADNPIAATLCAMAVHGYRHVPILDDHDKVVGIVSPQRVTNFLLQHLEPSR